MYGNNSVVMNMSALANSTDSAASDKAHGDISALAALTFILDNYVTVFILIVGIAGNLGSAHNLIAVI